MGYEKFDIHGNLRVTSLMPPTHKKENLDKGFLSIIPLIRRKTRALFQGGGVVALGPGGWGPLDSDEIT